MADRLWVATRKGLFRIDRNKDTWRINPPSFLGDPVSYVLQDPRDGIVYAALDLGHFGVKLHRSSDAGAHWEEITTPAYPKTEPEEKGASLTLLWCLAAGIIDQPGQLWAGTIPGGLFRSDNRGDSWVLNNALWNLPERKEWQGGGYDEPGIHSICIDPQNGACITIGVSIGGVWHSHNGGESWQPRGNGLRAAYVPPELSKINHFQDAHAIRSAATDPDTLWCQHHNGIFVSKNGGEKWTELLNVAPSVFGFALAVHPHHPDTAWFVPAVKDETRVPVNARLVVNRTRDGGKTFESLSKGLPEKQCYDLVYRHGLDVDKTGLQLAMGSTTGNLWISENSGENWQEIATHLPPIYAVHFSE